MTTTATTPVQPISAHVAALLATAPPLSDRQRDRITALFRQGTTSRQ